MSNFAGAVEAGRAYVAFGADDKPFRRTMKRMQQSIRQFGTSLQAAGVKLFAGGLIAAGPLAAAFRAFAELEGNLTFLAGVVGKTREDMKGLENTIMDLGATTVFTLDQVAEASTALGRAGFSEAQIITSLDSVLAFAQATRTELADAAEITADSIRAFGLSVTDAGDVVDTLTKTSNSSSQSMEDLKESLSFVAAQANVAGINIEDTALFLGILANNGQKASIAGTGLQRTLINLQSAAKQKTLKNLGVDVRDLDGNMKPLPQLFNELEGALADYDNVARNAVFNDIFGRGARAANILSRAFLEGSDVTGQFATEAEALQDAIEGASSAMEIQADISDSAYGIMKRLVSAFEAMKNAIGKGVALSGLAEELTEFFNGMQRVVETNPKFIAQFAKATVVVGGVGAALLVVGGAITAAINVLGPLITAVVALGGALGTTGVAIGLIATGLLGMTGNIDKWLGQLGNWLGLLGKGFRFVKDLIVSGDLDLAWEALMNTLEYGWRSMLGVLKGLWYDFLNLVFDSDAMKSLDSLLGTRLAFRSKSSTNIADEERRLYNQKQSAIAATQQARATAYAAEKAREKAEAEEKAAEELAKQEAIQGRQGGSTTGLEDEAAAELKRQEDERKRAIDERARLQQKGDELEIDRLKNKLEIDKRRTQEAQRLRTVAEGPSSADIRSAAGFNPLLASQNGIVAAVKGVELAVREAAIRDQELQVERRGIDLSIARNTAALNEVNATF